MKKNLIKKYSYLWITLVLFLSSLGAHWTFAWYAFVKDQKDHHQPVEWKDYFVVTARDTFENWQSEFLQLIWQVTGLAFLIYVGSPQSKEGDDRLEAKLDLIIKKLDPDGGTKEIRSLDRKYFRKISDEA